METLRAFIAIEMPAHVKDVVRECQQALGRAGVHLRWVKPENVHLTLRFLGDISTDTVEGIKSSLEKLADETPAFSLQIKGAGVFPGLTRPRVVWLGLGGQKLLLGEMYCRLSRLLSGQGIPEEKKPFQGHLTIGRAKGPVDPDLLRAKMAELSILEDRLFPADRICLFKSDLGPGGAVYTPLVRVRAAGPPTVETGA